MIGVYRLRLDGGEAIRRLRSDSGGKLEKIKDGLHFGHGPAATPPVDLLYIERALVPSRQEKERARTSLWSEPQRSVTLGSHSAAVRNYYSVSVTRCNLSQKDACANHLSSCLCPPSSWQLQPECRDRRWPCPPGDIQKCSLTI